MTGMGESEWGYVMLKGSANNMRKTILGTVILFVSCCLGLAQNPGTPRDLNLHCKPIDTNRVVWVAILTETYHSTNSYQFTNRVALFEFISKLPDRSRIWYGFEEDPASVEVGTAKFDTKDFRTFCNVHGVLLSWNVGW